VIILHLSRHSLVISSSLLITSPHRILSNSGKYLDRKKHMGDASEVVVKQYPILAANPGNRNPMNQSIRSEH